MKLITTELILKKLKTQQLGLALKKAGQLEEVELAGSVAIWRECRAEVSKPHVRPGDAGPAESHLGPGSVSETVGKRYQTDLVSLYDAAKLPKEENHNRMDKGQTHELSLHPSYSPELI